MLQPVIPLPDKVPTVTGEEDEIVVYCHRAKLYRFVEGEWKDRGVGDFKVLKHKTTHKVSNGYFNVDCGILAFDRLVMRRDQVLKLCMNHHLTPELKFAAKDEKSWMWCAPDFAEGHVTNEKFALRFKTKEIAEEFREVICKTQQSNSAPTTVVVSKTSSYYQFFWRLMGLLGESIFTMDTINFTSLHCSLILLPVLLEIVQTTGGFHLHRGHIGSGYSFA
ncbi:hypothetical protein PR048_004525 [Dryococelus australis]|uniref:RanBD1 domain-containing protein n=1 Tax=Dryococelus australis TaxID=614101 RepID=A0ABQ9I5N8_9NEOP|nr:hypothetical protein PR048_004525 [Dryococelus australis]